MVSKLFTVFALSIAIVSAASGETIVVNETAYHLGDTINSKWEPCAPTSPAAQYPIFEFSSSCDQKRTFLFHIWASGTDKGEVYVDGELVSQIVAIGVCPFLETIHVLDLEPGVHQLELRPGLISGGSEYDDFVFGTIEFDTQDCVVANDNVSWGGLKSVYR